MTILEISPLATVLIIGGLGVGAMVLIVSLLQYRSESAKRSKDNKDQIDKLTADMALMQKEFSPFWAVVQSKIAADLTHPSPQFAEMDKLLKKLEALDITDAERNRLNQLLSDRIQTNDPEVSEAEKKSAKIMIEVMEKVIIENIELAAS